MESEIEMQDNYKVCRLCQNPNSDEELISPCGCDGINQWVHRSCLNSYRIFYNDPVYFLKCPVCKVDYTFKHIEQPIKWLITKMVFKLIFQVLMLFAELIALFYLIGIIPYALDANGFHIFIKEDDSKWFKSKDFGWQLLVYGMLTSCFFLGLWSIAGLFKRCFCKSEYDEKLEFHDTQRIGACCSLTLCCMPFIYKKSFLYDWGCCQCCACCPNTCYNCWDCGDCLTCLICCDCCTDCCFVSPYHPHYFIWMPHPLFYHPPPPPGTGTCFCCCNACTFNVGDIGGCCHCDSGDEAGKIFIIALVVIVLIIIFIGVVVGTLAFFVFLAYLIKMNFEYIKKQVDTEIYIIDNWDPSIHPMPVQDPPTSQPLYNQDFVDPNQQYAQPLNPVPPVYNPPMPQQPYYDQQIYGQPVYGQQMYNDQNGVIYDVPPPMQHQNYVDPMIPQ